MLSLLGLAVPIRRRAPGRRDRRTRAAFRPLSPARGPRSITRQTREVSMTALPHRTLGTGGLSVSTVGLGLMSLSGVYGEADDAKSEELIRYAIDLGVNHLDSSDMYGWGHNEILLGRAIKGRRDKVVLATKFGQV